MKNPRGFLADPPLPIRTGAVQVAEIYTAYLMAGFTTDQATQFTIANIRAAGVAHA